ncbi:hypothetical protein Nmel_013770 [Mimus melanotis]
MAAGFFISKTVGVVAIVLGVGAVATIIALSVVYAQEKNKGTSDMGTTTTASPNTTTTITPAPNNSWNQWRLPDTLKPESYEVSLQPFLTPDANNMYIFKGNSSVVFVCEKATDLILIHSNKLNYTMQGSFHATLQAEDGGALPAISRTWLETTTQYLVVQLGAPLQQGRRYRLSSSFTGELADDLAGFYRSEYTDKSGTRHVVATTQMQAADARKAFPCFDEPAMKANFTVTLIHPTNYEAISNMPVKNTGQQIIDGETWSVTEFHTTPRMSTYLLAFIVSQFDHVDNSSGILIRIWGRPEAIKEGQGAYALNVTGPILSFFEDHYNTSYPLPKSDQVGLPDFNAGAMENWGLVTYRENSLLFDANYSSISNKERVVTVIAHELAHQWFGNLVTLRWWNDLWLNEGFASYVEYLGADSAEPEWNIKDLMVLNELHDVMATDALASSHPLSFSENEIKTPAQISEVFDSIAYSKGASVLRMLSSFLSEDIFKEGLQSYLHTFSYNNTVYTDLWVHLQQAVQKNNVQLPDTISNIMDRWTLQMGFPVVTVNTLNGTVSQKHFLLDPTSTVDRPSDFNYVWIVPITWMKGNNQGNGSYWLTDVSGTNNDFGFTSSWLLLNLNVTGYFRVNYNQENWDQLLRQLGTDQTAIPVINRAQIIDDAFNLARAKYVNVTLALDTTLFLSRETEYMPWQAALTNLKYFQEMFDRSELFGDMTKYIKNQVKPLFEHYKTITNDWQTRPDGLMAQYNEINAISTACSYGLLECQQLATGYYQQWRDTNTNPPGAVCVVRLARLGAPGTDGSYPNRVPPNLRSAIYCSMVATGGEEVWDFIWEQFRNASVVSEADKLRTALTCSPHPWILNRYLQYTLDPTKIRRQDATSTINSIASNVVGQPLVWDFIRGNWRVLFSQYGGGSFSFSRLILSVTQRFSSEFELQELEQFKKDNEDIGFGSGTRALEQALERTRTNINWVKENQAAVMQWFKDHSS